MKEKHHVTDGNQDKLQQDYEAVQKYLQKAEERKLKREAELQGRGTVSKELFARKCETTPEILLKQVTDFVLHYPFELGTLSAKVIRGQILIVHNDFLSIGHVEGQPINNYETWIEVVVYSTNQTIDETKQLYEEANRFFESLCQRFEEYWGRNCTTNKPNKPSKPTKGSDIALWLDYFHQMKDSGYKITLNDIAEWSGYSYGYIKQVHTRYKSEHGLA